MDEVETTPCRNDFQIAIICAVPKEAEAVEKLFDRTWKSGELGRHPGDRNTYTVGRIGNALVVVVWLDGYGKTKAATAAAHLLFSFKYIEHALVVGICGGVPITGGVQDTVLGDVVISTELQSYDQGKQYPHGYRTAGVARPRKDMGAFIRKLSASGQSRRTLNEYAANHLQRMLSRDEEYAGRVQYPGEHEDVLHSPAHMHKHYPPSVCYACTDTAWVCEEARDKSCSDLNCNTSGGAQSTHRDQRKSSSKAMSPTIHFGIVGSGDTVMKSAQHRDQIAERENIIAFEMEGAGVYEEIASIVVIKGVCDYADSHKSKSWQRYAATVAAACTGAFLEMKEEEYGHGSLQRKNSHASIATMDSVMSTRSKSTSAITAETSLARHSSGGNGSYKISPVRRASGPASNSIASSADGFLRNRTQSTTSEPPLDYLTWAGHGFSRNGMYTQSLNHQERMSMTELSRPASNASFGGVAVQNVTPRSQTYASSQRQDDLPSSYFPALSSLSLEDSTMHKPAEEAASALLDTYNESNDFTAANRLLEDSTFHINAQNAKGKSIAHLVLGTANVTSNRSKMMRSAYAIQFLCRQGVDLNVADNAGMSPLHWCVKTANTVAARYLIEAGVHINVRDKDGRTPLYLLGIDGSPILEMVEVLIRAGANLNGKKLPALSGRPKEAQRAVRTRLMRVP